MIILFGYSKLAAQLSSELAIHKHKFCIVEPSQKEFQFAQNDSYTTLLYDYECYDDNELLKLGIQQDNTKTLFCVHNDFNRNLFITLSARNLNRSLQIIAIANDENEKKKLKLAGATVVINPYEVAALNIFRTISNPLAVNILDDILYGKLGLQIQEITIKQGSILDGQHSKEVTIFDEFNIILLGIQDKEITKKFIFSSRGINHKIDVDDVIVVLGKQEDIEKFKEKINYEE